MLFHLTPIISLTIENFRHPSPCAIAKAMGAHGMERGSRVFKLKTVDGVR